MVGVAQLVEPWIVIPVVVGSSPIVHPIFWNARVAHLKVTLVSVSEEAPDGGSLGPLAQLVEQLTLNQLVVGSSPTWPTNKKARP